MKSTALLSTLVLLSGIAFGQADKKEQDIAAIKSLAGCYEVNFNFTETFATDADYTFHEPHHSAAHEYVFVLEATDDFISLQHLLMVNDTLIIKHWRQDWVYEEDEVLTYNSGKHWTTVKYSPEEVKGTWTQKVYQVDDSPRYQSKGTWVLVDGKHYWESVCDAPLPRRERKRRADYDVLNRQNRIEISGDGWFFEQDNAKVIRRNGTDAVLVREKGMETFTTGNIDCASAIAFWENNNGYWESVRLAWEEIIDENPELNLETRVNDQLLWQALFELGEQNAARAADDAQKAEAKSIIERYLKDA